MTHTLEFTTEELQELHVTLVVHLGNLRENLSVYRNDPTKDVQTGIVMRQIDRIRPLTYQVESMVRELHAKA
jgi:hypothetical protein